MLSRLRSLRRDRDGSRDAGTTLIELIVSMSIFAMFLAVVFGLIGDMTSTMRKTTGIADASMDGRKVFTMLDKQVRYASAINRPGLVGTDWYVEIETTATGTDSCTQWRLRGATDLMQTRSWTVTGGAIVTPAWKTVGTGFVNGAGQQPFTFTPAQAAMQKQRLDVLLVVSKGGNPPGRSLTQTSFVARNTGTKTPSNDDLNSDGQSDNPVCQQVSRS